MGPDRSQSSLNGLIGIEQGHIYFFYQSRECHPRSINDVRMLFCVLHAHDARYYRLLIMDNKRLPSVSSNIGSTTGRIARVNGKNEVLHYLMGETTERMYRVQSISHVLAQQCAEGVYTIAIKESKTFLFFMLDIPDGERDISAQLGITHEAHFGVGIQNPWCKNGAGDEMVPAIPDSLKSSFDGERVIFTMIPLLLNYEQIQVVFFSADLNFMGQQVSGRLSGDAELLRELFDELEIQKEKYPVVSMLHNSKQVRR
jgi:hypothetical protein